MQVVTLSGPGKMVSPSVRIQNALKRVDSKSFAAHLLRNELYRLSGTATSGRGRTAIPSYKQFLESKLALYPNKKSLIRQLILKEINLISGNSFAGNIAFPVNGIEGIGILKKLRNKLKKGVKNIVKEAGKVAKKGFQILKKVNMAPARNAFLLLTKINARGLASGMASGDRAQIDKLWKRFGGNTKNLNAAINQGKKKKPLFGGKQTAIRGINGEPVSTASAIVAAAPIIAAIVKLLGNSRKNKTDPNFIGPMPDGEGGSTTVWDQLKDLGGDLVGSGALTSLAPDAMVIPENGADDDAGLPSDDDDVNKAASGFEINPLLLLGGAGLAFVLLNKK